MRISDWSSDVCSSDLNPYYNDLPDSVKQMYTQDPFDELKAGGASATVNIDAGWTNIKSITAFRYSRNAGLVDTDGTPAPVLARSEEHTSELQSLMRISYAVFCLKKKI